MTISDLVYVESWEKGILQGTRTGEKKRTGPEKMANLVGEHEGIEG